MLYHVGDSWHTHNIQINKVIGEDEKCVFYFTEKRKPYGFFGQPNITESMFILEICRKPGITFY